MAVSVKRMKSGYWRYVHRGQGIPNGGCKARVVVLVLGKSYSFVQPWISARKKGTVSRAMTGIANML